MASLTFNPGPAPRTVRTPDGRVLPVPDGWSLLQPGDAALTRRAKAAGEHWLIEERQGRRIFSQGVWAPAATVERIRGELVAERATGHYAKRKAADAKRRAAAQAGYVDEFIQAVLTFLQFHPVHADLARQLAEAVAAHATPVGSGTVARTQRIPIERRAEAAVIAWMRHQTTGYDTMHVPRVKGERRAVRRMLAQRSHALLHRYRQGLPPAATCPLAQALQSADQAVESGSV